MVIKVLHTSDGAVRLGIEAPDHIRVLRSELLDRIEEPASSSNESPADSSAEPVTVGAQEGGAESEGLVDVADSEPQHPTAWDMAISDQFPQAV